MRRALARTWRVGLAGALALALAVDLAGAVLARARVARGAGGAVRTVGGGAAVGGAAVELVVVGAGTTVTGGVVIARRGDVRVEDIVETWAKECRGQSLSWWRLEAVNL